MIDINMKLRLLRMVLGFAACVWGVSIFGVFLSWSAAAEALSELGAKPIAYDPMLDYFRTYREVLSKTVGDDVRSLHIP
jgi:hypothetical protein